MTWSGAISARDILIVVDMQNDFCAGGALAVPDADDIVPIVNRVAPLFPHVMLTQDWHPPNHVSFASNHPNAKPYQTIEVSYGLQMLWPDHCIQDSYGAAFRETLAVRGVELILRKGFRPTIDSYSAFVENDRATPTGLAGYLRERSLSRVFLAGLAFDYCVRFSSEDACKEGFEVVVIEDACRSIAAQSRAETFASMSHNEVSLIVSGDLV
jgi:nicotinamidase/pyrazinamidase